MSRFILSVALLSGASLLSGCVAVPCGNGNVCYQPIPPQPVAVAPYPGYPGYPPPAPGYAPPDAAYGDPDDIPTAGTYVGPDGLTYVDGAPYAVFDGVQEAILFDAALGWGWYDGYHRWHGAPSDFRSRMDRYHPGGRGFPADAAHGRPGPRFGGGGGGPGPRFNGGGGRPGFGEPAGRPENRPAAGLPPGGFRGGPGGAPQGYRGPAQPAAMRAPSQSFARPAPPAAAARPAPAARRCEPGQHC